MTVVMCRRSKCHVGQEHTLDDCQPAICDPAHPAAAMDGSKKVGSVGGPEDPLALPPVCAMKAGDRKQGARSAEPSRAWIRAVLGSSRRR